MKKLSNNDKLDAVLMNCPLEELPALIDRAQVIARARGRRQRSAPAIPALLRWESQQL